MPRPSDLQLPPPTDWQMFERWMADLFEADWESPATLHGRTGQPQFGVDIYGHPNGETALYGVQCKRKQAYADKTVTVAELQEEAEKAKGFEPRLSHFVLVVTGQRDGAVQRAAEELTQTNRAAGGFSVEVLFWDDIEQLYDKHQEVFEAHYGDLLRTIRALHQLPTPPADFTGRDAELAEMMSALDGGGVAISGLRGQGGVGKTALALVAAHKLAERYGDAQFYLDLKGRSEKPLTTAEAKIGRAHV